MDEMQLRSIFITLEQIRDAAQDELYSIANQKASENIFQNIIRILQGYSDRLLRQYMSILDSIIPSLSDLIALQDSMPLEIRMYNEMLLRNVNTFEYLYNNTLKNKKVFKAHKYNSRIELIFMLIESIKGHLEHMRIVNTRQQQSNDVSTITKKKKENMNISKRGYIDIDTYLIHELA